MLHVTSSESIADPVSAFRERRCALIVGHPGHELRVWGWMRSTAPVVAVLTDGSGRGADSRLALSLEVCRRASATIEDCFGSHTDADIYDAILHVNTGFFRDLSDRLAEFLRARKIDCVVGDQLEGYNPTHDLCRYIIDRAVRAIARDGSGIDNYAFDVVDFHPAPIDRAGALRIDLSPDDIARKIAVSRDYAAQAGGTLLAEVEAMLREQGEAAVGREYLVPIDAWSHVEPPPDYRPFYEAHGERQVNAGHYRSAITYRHHVAPIARALRTD